MIGVNEGRNRRVGGCRRKGGHPAQLGAGSGLISLAVGIALLWVKFLAYHLTGSTAVLSDALESIVNVVAALFAILFGVRHINASEHHRGLMLAIAFESVVKLAAFLPAADQLYGIEARRLSDGYGSGTSSTTVVVFAAAAAVSIALLVLTQIYLARISRRIFVSVESECMYPECSRISTSNWVRRSRSPALAGARGPGFGMERFRVSSYRHTATAWPRFIEPCSSRVPMRSSQWQ